MDIKEIKEEDVSDISRLAKELWSEAKFDKLQTEFRNVITSKKDIAFICRENLKPIAFAHISLRHEYVEGSSTSPVGYLEGIYVQEKYRNRGIAKDLLNKGEYWAQSKGCTEFASDCEFKNTLSQIFHRKVGFNEANRVVCYIKKLKQ